VLAREDRVAGFSPPVDLAAEVARLVGLLHGNPYRPVTLSRVALQAEIEPAIRAAFLERVEVGSSRFHPGETVSVQATLRSYRGETAGRTMAFPLPADLAPGTYKLSVCDGGRAARQDQERAPGRYAATDVDRLLDLLAAEPPDDALVLTLLETTKHPVVEGREMPRLPASARLALESPAAGGRTTEATATVRARHLERLEQVVIGCQLVEITVEAVR
jgi:hypothetical protein